jgi:hypothetical protein
VNSITNNSLANRFWEKLRILLLKKSLRLNRGYHQQKLLEMVPLWNGYASILNLISESFSTRCYVLVFLMKFFYELEQLNSLRANKFSLFYGRHKIFRTRMCIIDMYHIFLVSFQGIQSVLRKRQTYVKQLIIPSIKEVRMS